MTEATTTNGGAEEQRGGGRLGGLADKAQQQFGQLSTQARDWATHQGDIARQTVVERPFVSTGAAFAAGVIFGILLMRR